MMSRKREAVFMGIGILAGLALSGPAAQAATAVLTASPTSQTFYVDGQKVEFEAYSIHGNNFVKLRDIGKAVDFGVAYDSATNSVHIDPGAHYEQEVTQPAQTTTAPSGLTEESIQAALWGLMGKYPSGTYYGPFYRSASGGPYGAVSSNCAGWATLCSDAVFGDLPWRRVDRPSWDQIRPGDLMRFDTRSSGHVVVVLDKTDEYIMVTESGTTNEALWGGQYFKSWLEKQPGLTLYTRYPQ